MKYSTLYLDPGFDYINIYNQEGNLYYRVDEANETTNIMTITNLDDDISIWSFITTGVVHQIDTVFVR